MQFIFLEILPLLLIKLSVECIATINNCAHNDTFYNGFCSSLRRIIRKYKCELVWINTADANIIIESNSRQNVIYKSSCPTFLYNYASYTYNSNSCLFLY